VGFVVEGPERKLPRLGDQIDRGERLVSLHVFLTPQEIAQLVSAKEDVDIVIEQSRVSMRLAQEQLERLAAAKDAVAGTRLAELREVYERSKAAFNESRDKLPFLIKEPYDGLALARPVPLESPIAGKITRAHVAPGEFVIQGDALWTISDWSTLWLRVPVFEGDLGRIDREAPATVALPGTLQSASALPIKAPQPTRPNLRTTDLLYEVSNADLALRSGQSVSIDLPTGAAAEQVVVPRSALLWDGLGNSWVYVRASSDSFRRQKVEIGRLVGDQVVIARGLSEDEQVVTVAAASLYGEEFKTEMPAEDDD
jgi:RND family efflux transporter MFP subunit